MQTAPPKVQEQAKKVLRSFWPRSLPSRKQAAKTTVLMRSAERVDRVFSANWLQTEFVHGSYAPTDLNVPTELRNPQLFVHNSPITNLGKYSSQLMGRALQNRGLAPKQIVCSPALRSVQTAAAIAKVVGVQISVEPGLLEPLSWYRAAGAIRLPDFGIDSLTIYPIDRSYTPIYTLEEVQAQFEHKQADCVSRIEMVLQSICGAPRDYPVLVVAHAITLELANQLGLFGGKIESDENGDVDCTSYAMPENSFTAEGAGQKLDLGVKYPPGSVMAVARCNNSPPYVFRLLDDIVAPLSTKNFSTRIGI